MTTAPSAIMTELLNVASRSGMFDVTRIGEFKKPTTGKAFCVFASEYGSASDGSGLSTTAGLIQVTARIQLPLNYQPEDAVEGLVLDAADAYLVGINGGFTLGGLVRNVDLLAAQGVPLVWSLGYLVIENTAFRIADLPLRAVLNDQWTQAA